MFCFGGNFAEKEKSKQKAEKNIDGKPQKKRLKNRRLFLSIRVDIYIS